MAKDWSTVNIDRHALVYVALTKTCNLLRWNGDGNLPTSTVVPELTSDHEEADTRLILHAAHASSQGSTTIIWSPDTDVAIIALGTIAIDCNRTVWFATGTGNRRRLIDLSHMALHLGKDISSALIGLHALTGCDSVSSFYGRGKKVCFKVLLAAQDSPEIISALKELGTEFHPNDQLLNHIEQFVCRLYGSNSNSVNDAR